MSKFFCGLFLGLLICHPLAKTCEIVSEVCDAAINRVNQKIEEEELNMKKSSVKLAE